jgi:hypothetical protein
VYAGAIPFNVHTPLWTSSIKFEPLRKKYQSESWARKTSASRICCYYILALAECISVLTFSSSLVLELFIMSFPHFGKKQKFFSKENPQLEQNFALN